VLHLVQHVPDGSTHRSTVGSTLIYPDSSSVGLTFSSANRVAEC
jgi:hypothetical protein